MDDRNTGHRTRGRWSGNHSGAEPLPDEKAVVAGTGKERTERSAQTGFVEPIGVFGQRLFDTFIEPRLQRAAEPLPRGSLDRALGRFANTFGKNSFGETANQPLALPILNFSRGGLAQSQFDNAVIEKRLAQFPAEH